MTLSARLRPDVEAAPWVIEEVKKQEALLRQALEALEKASDTTYSDTCLAQFNEAITAIKEALK